MHTSSCRGGTGSRAQGTTQVGTWEMMAGARSAIISGSKPLHSLTYWQICPRCGMGQKCIYNSFYQLKDFCLLMKVQSCIVIVKLRGWGIPSSKDLTLLQYLLRAANYSKHFRTGWIFSLFFHFVRTGRIKPDFTIKCHNIFLQAWHYDWIIMQMLLVEGVKVEKF